MQPQTEAPRLAANEGRCRSESTEPSWRAHRTPRRFIAHRGVHLHSTIAGENSLEAVWLARRAGFACIETDVRLSADGHFVIMHDESINRTATHADGREIVEPVLVAETTLERLREDYRLRARGAAQRTPIPTAEEFLVECERAGLLPFIEIKPLDQPAEFYLDLLDLADGILGRGGYVMTSNGNANRIIRGLDIDDVPMMDILYQAPSFEDVAALGDVIVAVSATRYEPAEHLALVREADQAGLWTESHADDLGAYAIVDAHGVDLISTDALAPDLSSHARILLSESGHEYAAFRHEGIVEGRTLLLASGARLAHPRPPRVGFGGVFLEVELQGACTIRLGSQVLRIESPELRRHRHQVMLFDEAAKLIVAAEGECRIHDLRLTVAEY
ncbi:MAG: hypothetical protein KDB18_06340 [Salinibacterium sp.]|nr:hypothetical protein [Salinibacterium sp.]